MVGSSSAASTSPLVGIAVGIVSVAMGWFVWSNFDRVERYLRLVPGLRGRRAATAYLTGMGVLVVVLSIVNLL